MKKALIKSIILVIIAIVLAGATAHLSQEGRITEECAQIAYLACVLASIVGTGIFFIQEV